MNTHHSTTLLTWMAHVGRESALLGSSRRNCEAAAASGEHHDKAIAAAANPVAGSIACSVLVSLGASGLLLEQAQCLLTGRRPGIECTVFTRDVFRAPEHFALGSCSTILDMSSTLKGCKQRVADAARGCAQSSLERLT